MLRPLSISLFKQKNVVFFLNMNVPLLVEVESLSAEVGVTEVICEYFISAVNSLCPAFLHPSRFYIIL